MSEEVTVQLLTELDGLIWAMVWDIANPARWRLEADEVRQELVLELVNAVYEYGDKPYTEIKYIAITCMRNRVRDLASMCYSTHRKAEDFVMDVDDPMCQPGYIPSDFDLKDFLGNLSVDAQRLALETLYPSDRTLWFIDMSIERKRWVTEGNGWKFEMTPTFMMRALGWNRERLLVAWEEVQATLTLH